MLPVKQQWLLPKDICANAYRTLIERQTLTQPAAVEPKLRVFALRLLGISQATVCQTLIRLIRVVAALRPRTTALFVTETASIFHAAPFTNPERCPGNHESRCTLHTARRSFSRHRNLACYSVRTRCNSGKPNREFGFTKLGIYDNREIQKEIDAMTQPDANRQDRSDRPPFRRYSVGIDSAIRR